MGRSTIVLQRECFEITELQRYLLQVRRVLKGKPATRVEELLDSLFAEISCCSSILSSRLKSLCADDHTVDLQQTPAPEYFWRIPDGNAGCIEMLDSLHSAYAHCARTTAESMSAIAQLDDPESFAVLSWVWAATRQALYFLGACLAGMLPEWKPTSPPVGFSTGIQGSTILLRMA